MDDLISAGVRSVFLSYILKNALIIGVALAWLGWGIMAMRWRATRWAALYEKTKQESNLEPLLATPEKEETDTKMEGLTTFDFPEPEDEPLTKICPECGALYPEYRVDCYSDKNRLQPFRKPVTEPLQASVKRNDLAQEIDEAEELFEEELDKIRTELEESACRYGNYRRPYTFSKEETRRLYALYSEVREQSQEEKAS